MQVSLAYEETIGMEAANVVHEWSPFCLRTAIGMPVA
jgi:hypothetical protein